MTGGTCAGVDCSGGWHVEFDVAGRDGDPREYLKFTTSHPAERRDCCFWRFAMKVLTRAGLIAGILLLAGTALAQVPDFDPSMLPLLWENPLFMAAAIVGLVAAIRKSQAWLDGAILVPAFAAALGALLGAAGQFAQMLTVQPFAEWTFPVGGLLYGALCAILGTTGLNLLEYVGKLFNRNRVDPAALLLVGGHNMNAGAWIVEYVKGLVGSNKHTAAIEAVAPLIKEFTGRVLSDELRADLQGRIHTTLRKANLITGKSL